MICETFVQPALGQIQVNERWSFSSAKDDLGGQSSDFMEQVLGSHVGFCVESLEAFAQDCPRMG